MRNRRRRKNEPVRKNQLVQKWYKKGQKFAPLLAQPPPPVISVVGQAPSPVIVTQAPPTVVGQTSRLPRRPPGVPPVQAISSFRFQQSRFQLFQRFSFLEICVHLCPSVVLSLLFQLLKTARDPCSQLGFWSLEFIWCWGFGIWNLKFVPGVRRPLSVVPWSQLGAWSFFGFWCLDPRSLVVPWSGAFRVGRRCPSAPSSDLCPLTSDLCPLTSK